MIKLSKKIINNDLYQYKCPEKLGYLDIKLDLKNRAVSAIFTDKKILYQNIPPKEIIVALDDYFNNKKNIPKSLISDEITGTVFQKSIWKVISSVRFGQTITYSEIAEKLGNTNAVRAAGTACGKNPIALFIPCHRIVRKTGEDHGYSWGKKRKEWLLNFECGK